MVFSARRNSVAQGGNVLIRIRPISRALLVAFALGGTALLLASVWRGRTSAQAPDYTAMFNKTDVMIPARDGVKLHTEIYVPKDAKEPLPFFLTRTPYGLCDDDKGYSHELNLYREMIPDGYIFVFQDIRGRYGSEGKFVMQRDPRDPKDPHSIDEGTDTYDTIDWLVKNIPNNNGRAGEAGISYGGWLTAMSLIEPHPALKAVSEQASPSDMFLGDDFHHNGAFRLSYGFEYAALMETDKTNFQFQFDKYDTYDWYLALGPLSNANALYLHGKLPTWNNFVAHPNYDEFWDKQAFTRYFKNLTLQVPNLNVAGWWDQEDFYGPMRIYELLEQHDAKHNNYVAVGPWNHGGWARDPGDKLGNIDFGGNTAEYFRAKIQAPWFAHWLKDKGELPAARGGDVRNRLESVEKLGRLASSRRRYAEPLVFPRERRPFLRASGRGGESRRRRLPRHRRLRYLHFRSRESSPVSPSPDRGNLLGREPLVHVACRRPALRRASPGHAVVGDRSADERRHRSRQHRRASLRLHQRHRQRLDREADRRLSRKIRARPQNGRLRVDGRGRSISRQVPQ